MPARPSAASAAVRRQIAKPFPGSEPSLRGRPCAADCSPRPLTCACAAGTGNLCATAFGAESIAGFAAGFSLVTLAVRLFAGARAAPSRASSARAAGALLGARELTPAADWSQPTNLRTVLRAVSTCVLSCREDDRAAIDSIFARVDTLPHTPPTAAQQPRRQQHLPAPDAVAAHPPSLAPARAVKRGVVRGIGGELIKELGERLVQPTGQDRQTSAPGSMALPQPSLPRMTHRQPRNQKRVRVKPQARGRARARRRRSQSWRS